MTGISSRDERACGRSKKGMRCAGYDEGYGDAEEEATSDPASCISLGTLGEYTKSVSLGSDSLGQEWRDTCPCSCWGGSKEELGVQPPLAVLRPTLHGGYGNDPSATFASDRDRELEARDRHLAAGAASAAA